MGSPELPNEDENTIQRPQVNNLPMHGAVGGTTSDESDIENDDGYAGYQPLALDDEINDFNMDDEDNEDIDNDFPSNFASFQVSLQIRKLNLAISILNYCIRQQI